jgi:ribonuclease R
VQLTKYFVEGLVHVTNLGSDYFIFDEHRMTLTGRRSGKVFMLGTKVKVRLTAANIVKHQLDFELLGSEPERPKGRPERSKDNAGRPHHSGERPKRDFRRRR